MYENEECAELKKRLAELKKRLDKLEGALNGNDKLTVDDVFGAGSKEPQVTVREIADLEKKDWRGILAVGTLVGFFGTAIVTLFYRPELLGEILKLDTLVIMALQFYFTVRKNGA